MSILNDFWYSLYVYKIILKYILENKTLYNYFQWWTHTIFELSYEFRRIAPVNMQKVYNVTCI